MKYARLSLPPAGGPWRVEQEVSFFVSCASRKENKEVDGVWAGVWRLWAAALPWLALWVNSTDPAKKFCACR